MGGRFVLPPQKYNEQTITQIMAEIMAYPGLCSVDQDA